MAVHIHGGTTKVKGVFVQNAPNTYDANTPPCDVQKGDIYYANGKRCVGTGRAFEFAEYGSRVVKKIIDSNGVERYGVSLALGENTNIIFVAPNIGDIVLQDNYLVNIKSGEISNIGENYTTGGEINAYFDKDRVIVYLTNYSGKTTILRIFAGKDNYI